MTIFICLLLHLLYIAYYTYGNLLMHGLKEIKKHFHLLVKIILLINLLKNNGKLSLIIKWVIV